jgi:membrane-associated protein
MEFLKDFFDILIHLDAHLAELVANYGTWTYAILFLIIFCETGLVITPFLPGDSLLFAAGTLAAITTLDVNLLAFLLFVAAVGGDNTNYWIGYFTGPKVFTKEKSRLLNREYLLRTHKFYERHGGKTTIIARFMPIIRTFAPFVAGIARMSYRRFLIFDILGGILWIGSFIYLGYFFGNIPIVKNNFSIVIVVIVFISILPGIIAFLKEKFIRETVQE